MSGTTTTTAAVVAEAGTHTVLRFDDEDDHCRYDPNALLAALTAPERAAVVELYPTAADDWVTTTDLYCAVEDLEELGRRDLAETINQFIHAENLYGCLCRNEALTAFKDRVAAVLTAIEDRVPHGSWWTGDRVYTGLDVDDLLDDLLRASGERADAADVTFTFDAHGNGSVTSDTTSLRIVAFTTPEIGTFVKRLDDGYIATDGDLGTAVADWLQLPTSVRETMASLHYHDVVVYEDGPRGVDLPLGRLEHVARSLTALPEPDWRAIVSLLPGTTSTLENLVTAVQATRDC